MLDIAESIHRDAVETMKRKNNDYADEGEVFGNLDFCENMGWAKTEAGILIRIGDKLSRLHNLVCEGKEAAVMDESVRDTVEDAINYLILLYAKHRSRVPDG